MMSISIRRWMRAPERIAEAGPFQPGASAGTRRGFGALLTALIGAAVVCASMTVMAAAQGAPESEVAAKADCVDFRAYLEFGPCSEGKGHSANAQTRAAAPPTAQAPRGDVAAAAILAGHAPRPRPLRR